MQHSTVNILISQQSENREFLIRVSYLEIYNENVVDLLVAHDAKTQVSFEISHVKYYMYLFPKYGFAC